jgi:hypothetical protein
MQWVLALIQNAVQVYIIPLTTIEFFDKQVDCRAVSIFRPSKQPNKLWPARCFVPKFGGLSTNLYTMIKTMKRFLLISLFFSIPYISLAWGVLGHRIVGEIADSYLTLKAKTEIKKILGNESIAMSSNWGDFIKSDTSFRYLNPWHYISIEKGMTEEDVYEHLERDTVTDIYTKTNFLIKELKKKNLAIDKKRFYLRLLVHFVGDMHQPLHVGRSGDSGGNRVRLSWFNTPTNLHAVWDEYLVNFQQLSYTEYTRAINFSTTAQRKEWQKSPMSEWILESYKLTESLYTDIKEDNQKLSYDYNFKHIGTVNTRLLQGGVRLAGVLNQIFG